MEINTSNYHKHSSLFASSHVGMEEEKSKRNPFEEEIIMSSERRKSTSEIFTNVRKLETPSTPGRPVFSFSVPRKNNVPSKWDDAQKWLFNSSPAHNNNNNNNNFIFGNNNNNKNEGPRSSISKGRVSCDAIVEKMSRVIVPSDLPLKDKFTDEIEPFTPNFRYMEPTKEAFLFKSNKLDNKPMTDDACTEMIPYEEVKHRDVGTEMTPLGSSRTSRCHTPFKSTSPGSSRTSRCHTPFKSTSPARHNTPASRSGPLAMTVQESQIDMAQFQECHLAKLQNGSSPFDSVATNWSSREEEEEEISKSLRHFELGRRSLSVSESRACVWEEEEKSKSCLRYRREEAKIQAWINLQSAKAEAQSRKLEVKIQKMRSNLEEKIMKRMTIVNRKAEEWREAAQIEHSEQMKKATERTQKLIMLNHQKQISNLSSHIVSCGCFPCNSHH